MLGESQRHGRSTRLIALQLRRHRETQCSMGTDPIVLKELQVDEGIPGSVTFGKRMGLAGQGIEPITKGAVDTLDVDGGRCGDDLAQGGTDLDGEQLAMFIAMLDGLRQTHVWGHDQRGASTLARADRLTIGSADDRCIAPPAVAAPCQRTALRACDSQGHRSLDQIVADASTRASGDEAAEAVLHEASPAFASIGFVGSTVFFRTKDQNSSISTVESWRSCVRIAVKASACSLARRSHWPIVSYLWPVISSAARKLPRRITINSAWATSATGVCRRYIGVPSVAPKKRPHPRQ
jgi:hypothetical protein